ncbi:MAG: tRNA (adenosine(37)-N6)-threonylcarbamoyltransferase complex dimerization subunit type 1 TsaB [Clostridia bacterium]
MIVLAVDSTGPVAGVAVAEDRKILCEVSGNLGLTHSETLQPMIDWVMAQARLTVAQVDLFACVAGPGSFTGVRIGVCAIKAIAQATSKPCVALDALEVLAAQHFGFDGVICPILDARRGQVYGAQFAFEKGSAPVRLAKDDVLKLEDFVAQLPENGRVLFVGDGAQVHARAIGQLLGARALIAPDHLAQLRAGAACFLAPDKPACDYLTLAPIYLRAPQAEREREQRLERHG